MYMHVLINWLEKDPIFTLRLINPALSMFLKYILRKCVFTAILTMKTVAVAVAVTVLLYFNI